MAEEQTPYNAGDEQHVKKRKRSAKTRNLQKKAALQALMSTPGGRAWIWDLLILTGYSTNSFSTQALVMAFNEGKRSLGLQLIGEINRISPELYVGMALENQAKDEDWTGDDTDLDGWNQERETT
jgi:hypothetical protein